MNPQNMTGNKNGIPDITVYLMKQNSLFKTNLKQIIQFGGVKPYYPTT